MATLTKDQVQERMRGVAKWTLEGNTIRRQFGFPSFPDALAFVTRLAFDAEVADHHPDILISYKRVTLTYSTHSEGGLTPKDFEGARAADGLADRFSRS